MHTLLPFVIAFGSYARGSFERNSLRGEGASITAPCASVTAVASIICGGHHDRRGSETSRTRTGCMIKGEYTSFLLAVSQGLQMIYYLRNMQILIVYCNAAAVVSLLHVVPCCCSFKSRHTHYKRDVMGDGG